MISRPLKMVLTGLVSYSLVIPSAFAVESANTCKSNGDLELLLQEIDQTQNQLIDFDSDLVAVYESQLSQCSDCSTIDTTLKVIATFGGAAAASFVGTHQFNKIGERLDLRKAQVNELRSKTAVKERVISFEQDAKSPRLQKLNRLSARISHKSGAALVASSIFALVFIETAGLAASISGSRRATAEDTVTISTSNGEGAVLRADGRDSVVSLDKISGTNEGKIISSANLLKDFRENKGKLSSLLNQKLQAIEVRESVKMNTLKEHSPEWTRATAEMLAKKRVYIAGVSEALDEIKARTLRACKVLGETQELSHPIPLTPRQIEGTSISR